MSTESGPVESGNPSDEAGSDDVVERPPAAVAMTAHFPALARLETAIEGSDWVWYGLVGAIITTVALLVMGATPLLVLLLLVGGAIIAGFMLKQPDKNAHGTWASPDDAIVGAATPAVIEAAVDRRVPGKESGVTTPGTPASLTDIQPGLFVSVEPKPGTRAKRTAGIVVSVDVFGFQVLPPRAQMSGEVDGVRWQDVGRASLSPGPETLVRTYTGQQQADANRVFQREAHFLSWAGYQPSTQSWAAGQYGCGAFLLAVVLFIVVVGILIFLYMLIVKPDGTLTVTYSRRPRIAEPTAAPLPSPPLAAPATPEIRLGRLEDARRSGLVSEEEYASTRSRILDEF